MKKLPLVVALIALSATSAFAASKGTYKVTGPVTALDDNSITVQKGKESWQIARDAETKVPDTIKVGTKVTVMYTMTASSVVDRSAETPAKPVAAPAPAAAKPAAAPAKKAK